MIRLVLAFSILSLAACGSGNITVNRMNVDDARYERALAECKKASGISLSFRNPVATCMTSKGYQVLMENHSGRVDRLHRGYRLL